MALADKPVRQGKGFEQILKARLAGAPDKKSGHALLLKEGLSGMIRKELPVKGAARKSDKGVPAEAREEVARLAAALLKGQDANIPEKGTLVPVKGEEPGAKKAAVSARDGHTAPVARDNALPEGFRDLTAALGQDSEPKQVEGEESDRNLKFTVEDRRNPFSKQAASFRDRNHSGAGDRKGEDPGASGGKGENRITEAVFSVREAEGIKESAENVPLSRTRSSELLDRFLKARGNAEIAKNIHFVVKDSGMGEIHLTLRPETLGKVRINLRMEENRIVGHVIVDSAQVREIFLDNIQQISRMLEEQGYHQTALDVSVDDRQAAARDGQSDDNGKSYQEKYSERLRVSGETGAIRSGNGAGADPGHLDLIA